MLFVSVWGLQMKIQRIIRENSQRQIPPVLTCPRLSNTISQGSELRPPQLKPRHLLSLYVHLRESSDGGLCMNGGDAGIKLRKLNSSGFGRDIGPMIEGIRIWLVFSGSWMSWVADWDFVRVRYLRTCSTCNCELFRDYGSLFLFISKQGLYYNCFSILNYFGFSMLLECWRGSDICGVTGFKCFDTPDTPFWKIICFPLETRVLFRGLAKGIVSVSAVEEDATFLSISLNDVGEAEDCLMTSIVLLGCCLGILEREGGFISIDDSSKQIGSSSS